MNQMTAAHKTLPLPSVVEVSNLQNGRARAAARQRPRPVCRRPGDRRVAPGGAARSGSEQRARAGAGPGPEGGEHPGRRGGDARRDSARRTRSPGPPVAPPAAVAPPRPAPVQWPHAVVAPRLVVARRSAEPADRGTLPRQPPPPKRHGQSTPRAAPARTACRTPPRPTASSCRRESHAPAESPVADSSSAHRRSYRGRSPAPGARRNPVLPASVQTAMPAGFIVQAGAFAVPENAQRVRARIASLGNAENRLPARATARRCIGCGSGRWRARPRRDGCSAGCRSTAIPKRAWLTNRRGADGESSRRV